MISRNGSKINRLGPSVEILISDQQGMCSVYHVYWPLIIEDSGYAAPIIQVISRLAPPSSILGLVPVTSDLSQLYTLVAILRPILGCRMSYLRVLARSLPRLRVKTYYTKAKQKNKSSGQAWLLFGGVTATIVSGAVYVLGQLVVE